MQLSRHTRFCQSISERDPLGEVDDLIIGSLHDQDGWRIRGLSAKFDEVVARLDHLDHAVDQGLEPLDQSASSSVADANSDDRGRFTDENGHAREILVLRDENRVVLERIPPQLVIRRIRRTDVSHMLRVMTMSGQHPGERRRQLGVDEEAHWLGREQDRVIGLCSGVGEAGPDVVCRQVGVVLENLSL